MVELKIRKISYTESFNLMCLLPFLRLIVIRALLVPLSALMTGQITNLSYQVLITQECYQNYLIKDKFQPFLFKPIEIRCWTVSCDCEMVGLLFDPKLCRIFSSSSSSMTIGEPPILEALGILT